MVTASSNVVTEPISTLPPDEDQIRSDPEERAPLPGLSGPIYIYVAQGDVQGLGVAIKRANSDPNNRYQIVLLAGVAYNPLLPFPPNRYAYSVSGKVNLVGASLDQVLTSSLVDLVRPDRDAADNGFFSIRPGGVLNLYDIRLINGGGKSIPYGGAIRNSGTLHLHDVRFVDGSALNQGGAIYQGTGDAVLVITRAVFRGNAANVGGALANYKGKVQVNNVPGNHCVLFQDNSATINAGAVYTESGVTRLNRASFQNNVSPVYRDIEHSPVSPSWSVVEALNSWWLASPSISPRVVTTGVTVGGTRPAFDCIAPNPPPLLGFSDYGIVLEGIWTHQEKVAILNAASRTGLAFTLRSGRYTRPAPHQIFREIITGNTNGSLILRRVTNRVNCKTDNNYGVIECGNIANNGITEYVLVHEFGHVFDNKSNMNSQTNLIEYITEMLIDDSKKIKDNIGLVVMGNIIPCGFLRGERGWRTGAGSTYSLGGNPHCYPQRQRFTDFQQNPAPYLAEDGYTALQRAIQETSADMFLNWVYRSTNGNGFRNQSWSPLEYDPATGMRCDSIDNGCPDTRMPGDARYNWISARLQLIFAAHGW